MKLINNVPLPTLTPTLICPTKDTIVCIADADTRAVLGAKTSRARDIETRVDALFCKGSAPQWGAPSEAVCTFLEDNIAGYNHASIGDMAEVWAHIKGVGWPAAWLLQDSPLFRGQEVSTRAIDMTRVGSMCLGAPEKLQELHDRWVSLFQTLRAKKGSESGYKFDDVRWALPGTLPAGVTVTMDVRQATRQLEEIEGLGGAYADMAEQLHAAYAVYAPTSHAALRKGPRQPSVLWTHLEPLTKTNMMVLEDCGKDNTVNIAFTQTSSNTASWPGREARQHLDKVWNFLGTFHVKIRCSVAAARDWHRHRAVMPWRIRPMLDFAGELIWSPFYDMSEAPPELLNDTSAAFRRLHCTDTPWDSLYALPFGAAVELECNATLPYLLYMLELRYSATGANFEYKEQARQGLVELHRVLSCAVGADTLRKLGVLSALGAS